jgi:RNA 3'-terminal phosphate cyclase
MITVTVTAVWWQEFHSGFIEVDSNGMSFCYRPGQIRGGNQRSAASLGNSPSLPLGQSLTPGGPGYNHEFMIIVTVTAVWRQEFHSGFIEVDSNGMSFCYRPGQIRGGNQRSSHEKGEIFRRLRPSSTQ